MSETNPTIWRQLTRYLSGKFRPQHGVQETDPAGLGIRSGVIVSDYTAMQISAVWACVRLVSETVSTLPIAVYRRTEEGRNTEPEHQLARVLAQPNRYMTGVEFMEAMNANLAMHGNAYAVIQRNGVGQVSSLWPLYASAMDVDKLDDGTVIYRYTDGKNVNIYAAENILHVKGFGVSGLVGLSPLAYARQSIGLSIAAETYAAKFFGNGARPGGVLTIDRVLKPEQREALRKNFAGMHEGAENSHKLHVLEAGMNYQQIGIAPEDAQMLETRRFQIEDIARFFRVPSFLINDTAKSTSWGTGLEQQNLAFLAYSLRPYLTRWEQAINSSLITPPQKRTHYVEFNLEGLLRADSSARSSFYSQMVQNGLMTRNEVRRKENLPEVDNGDELTAQINLAPLDKLGETDQTEPSNAEAMV